MKKLSIAFFSILGICAYSQPKSFGERFSLEAGYGYVMPLGTFENGKSTDYSDFKNLHIGSHYLLTNHLGVRFSYNYTEFQHPTINYLGSTYHRFTLAATYDILNAFTNFETPYRSNKNIETLVYAGAGISFSQPDIDKSVLDQGLGIQFGIQPKYYITDNLSIFVDASYVLNTMRDYNIEGVALENKGTTSYVSAVFGVNYRFGK